MKSTAFYYLIVLALFLPATLPSQTTTGKDDLTSAKNLINPGPGGFDGGEPGGFFPCYTCTAAFSRDISYCMGQRDLDLAAANSTYVSCSSICAIFHSEGDSTLDQGYCALGCAAQLWQDDLNTHAEFENCVDQVILREHYCRLLCED